MQLVVGLEISADTNKENESAIWYQRKKTLLRNTTTFGGYLRIVHFQMQTDNRKSILMRVTFTDTVRKQEHDFRLK